MHWGTRTTDERWNDAMGRVCDLAELEVIRDESRRSGRLIVLTNGCFDLIHVGHTRYLRAACRLGDLLVVGVNSDSSVRRLKGPGRPVVNEVERAEVVAALESVDLAVIFSEDTAEGLIARLRPDVYVKGADYAPGAKYLPEAKVVREYGGRIEFVPLSPGHSTTSIIAAVLQRCR